MTDVTPDTYYRTPGPMTDLAGAPGVALRDLPDDPVALSGVLPGLVLHEEWAPDYGLELSEERRQQVRTRSAADMVDTILAMDPAPLMTARTPDRRMIGNCRHFATLSTALLRRAGIPARARCGFAAYFEPGKMVDHWVTEYRAGSGWVRLDAQLDAHQTARLVLDFNTADLPPEAFLTAGEAWRRCRNGVDDPDRYGIFDMWGLWFVASNVVRDLAALNKVELLPWDSWGPMTFRQDPDRDLTVLLDRVTGAIERDELSSVRDLYARADGLAVPDVIFDGRFGEPVQLSLGYPGAGSTIIR